MPPIKACAKQDYAGLIVIGVGVKDETTVTHRRNAEASTTDSCPFIAPIR